jgi:hypothetical protein
MHRIILTLFLLPMMVPAAHADNGSHRASRSASDEANWADWDAKARMTDGDYEGAIQAEQYAQATRRAADDLAARSLHRGTDGSGRRHRPCQSSQSDLPLTGAPEVCHH